MGFLKTNALKLVEDIGACGLVEPRIRSLLIQTEGGVDLRLLPNLAGIGQKEQNILSTLLIRLPTVHEGGDIQISRERERRIHNTDRTPAFDLIMIAWYNDTMHKMSPIVSGYHLLLVYDLVQERQKAPAQASCADIIHQNRTHLASCLHIQQKDHPDLTCLMYPLKNQAEAESNTTNRSCPAGAQGRLRAVRRCLDEVCPGNGFFYFFASMKTVTTETFYHTRPFDQYRMPHNVHRFEEDSDCGNDSN